jgi:hypothetical protein
MAARMISRLCYGDAWRIFGGLRDKCEFRIVSNSFNFLLEKVRVKGAGQGLKIECHGIKTDLGRTIILENSVVRKEDKHAKVKELLAQHDYEKAIVIGDTEDDIAMCDATVEILGKTNVLFISINAKDYKIEEVAEKSFKSWKELGLFLEK